MSLGLLSTQHHDGTNGVFSLNWGKDEDAYNIPLVEGYGKFVKDNDTLEVELHRGRERSAAYAQRSAYASLAESFV